jgi:hypothetical protein
VTLAWRGNGGNTIDVRRITNVTRKGANSNVPGIEALRFSSHY